MAPFTPFFTEALYQNLRKVSDGSEESIHYCSYPQEGGKVLIINKFCNIISNFIFGNYFLGDKLWHKVVGVGMVLTHLSGFLAGAPFAW